MNLRNTPESYGVISRLLHALIAVPLLGQIPLGWYTAGLSDESPVYWRLLALHETLGLGVLALMLFKTAWITISPSPEIARALPAWERMAARFMHMVLFLAAVIIPVTGFVYAASDGEPLDLYGIVEIPPLGHFGKVQRDLLFSCHRWTAYVCGLLIVVHVLAALKHHFIDGSGSLRRITF